MRGLDSRDGSMMLDGTSRNENLDTDPDTHRNIPEDIEDQVHKKQKQIAKRNFWSVCCLVLVVVILLAYYSAFFQLFTKTEPKNEYSLPKTMERLMNNIDVITIGDSFDIKTTIVLINDELTESSSFGFTTPVGYFNEQEGKYSNGVAYLISTALLLDDFYQNKELMNVQANVEPEASYWSSQTTQNKFMLENIQKVWSKIANFKGSQVHRVLVNLVRSMIAERLEHQEYARDTLVKKFVVKPDHVYARTAMGSFTSLNTETLEAQAEKFFYENYFVDEIKLVLVGKFGSKADPTQLARKKKEISEELKKMFANEDHKIRRKNPNVRLPHTELPYNGGVLLVTPGLERDALMIRFQLPTDYSQESKYESLLFIKFALNKLLREKLQEEHLMAKLLIDVIYHSSFSIFQVEIHLTHLGKSKIPKLVSSIFGAIRFLHNRKELQSDYELFRDELSRIYDTKGIYDPKRLTQMLMTKIPKYGLYEAFRATVTLYKFNNGLIRYLLEEMQRDTNWVLILSGDFSTAERSDSSVDVVTAFQSRVVNRFDQTSEAKIPGSVKLMVFDNDLGLRYTSQKLTPAEIKFVTMDQSAYVFEGYGINPYRITKEEMAKATQIANSGARDQFDPTKSEVADSKVVFYRKNQIFAFPMVYINIKFGHDAEKVSPDMPLNSIKYAEKILTITHVWRHRLRLIQNYLQEYNGDVDVHYAHGLVNLHIYGSREHIYRLLRDVLEKIDVHTMTELDVEEARERILNEYSGAIFEFQHVRRQVLNFILQNEFLDAQMRKAIQGDFYQMAHKEVDFKIVYSLFEGAVDPDLAKQLYNVMREKYAVNSGFYHFPTIEKFPKVTSQQTNHFLPIYRVKTNEGNKRMMYVTAIDFGPFTIFNYAGAQLTAEFLKVTSTEYFVEKKQLTNMVDIQVVRGSNHLLIFISFSILGDPMTLEQHMEDYLRYMASEFASYKSADHIDKFDLIRRRLLLRMDFSYTNLKDFAHDDANDLFLSRGQVEGLKMKARALLQSEAELETFRLIIKEKLLENKSRLVVEFTNYTGKESVKHKNTFGGLIPKVVQVVL